LDETGVSMSHRIMTVGSAESTKSSFSGGSSAGAIPGWDGKKNSIGCAHAPVAFLLSRYAVPCLLIIHVRFRFIRIPGTSTMFWDLEQSCPIFLPTLWIYPHINCVRFPDYLELGRHKQVRAHAPGLPAAPPPLSR
jgi:hypothetical protein